MTSQLLPSYQVDAGVPAWLKDGHVGRGVPDVAANGSYNSGNNIIINGTRRWGMDERGVASVGRADRAIDAASGENVGFVNRVIYALGSSVFATSSRRPVQPTTATAASLGTPRPPGGTPARDGAAPTAWRSCRAKGFYGPAIALDLQDGLQLERLPRARVPHAAGVQRRTPT